MYTCTYCTQARHWPVKGIKYRDCLHLGIISPLHPPLLLAARDRCIKLLRNRHLSRSLSIQIHIRIKLFRFLCQLRSYIFALSLLRLKFEQCGLELQHLVLYLAILIHYISITLTQLYGGNGFV